jgi:hypothetical protein
MDMSKLVVGQDVFIASGVYYINGKVITVTPEGVEVYVPKSNAVWGTNQVWRFNTEGKTNDGLGGTAEYGPWVIDDNPFAERKAELERAELMRTLMNKKYPDGSRIPANESLPPMFGGPFWCR